MTLVDEARKALGQLFMIGFTGLELSDDTSAFLSQAKIGGVILFSPNYETPGQLVELCNQVQECRATLPLWISTDHEGGKVQRFKKGFTRIPDAASIASMNSPKLAFEIAEVAAKELRAVGLNINFAPVTDINTNPKNPVIGTRAFGATEELVSKMTTAVVRGHLINGVQPCVKHFPGHGDTSTDSHYALPRVDTDPAMLHEREFRPFVKAFKSRCSLVMTAHIIASKLDPALPATLSPIIIRDLLRGQLRFSQVVISDDLEMKAITDHFGPDDAPRMAIEAGCDILIYRSEAAGRHAYAALTKALEDGKLAPELVLQSAARITNLKKSTLLPYQPAVVAEACKLIGIAEHQAIVQKVPEQQSKKFS